MYTKVGVTSFGRACGFVGEAGIYSRVVAFAPETRLYTPSRSDGTRRRKRGIYRCPSVRERAKHRWVLYDSGVFVGELREFLEVLPWVTTEEEKRGVRRTRSEQERELELEELKEAKWTMIRRRKQFVMWCATPERGECITRGTKRIFKGTEGIFAG